VVAHPEADSFVAEAAERYCKAVRSKGHHAQVRDLYRLGFDPVLKRTERTRTADRLPACVKAELAALQGVDVIVFVYPVWFGTPPAILKGYIERVFGAGFVFDSVTRPRHPILHGKTLVSITVSGSLSTWLHEHGVLNSLQNLFERYLAAVFGFGETYHRHLDGVVGGLPGWEYRMLLQQVEELARNVMSELTAESCSLALPPEPAPQAT
jgi:NAD(P)H dehydrogenase (quinone)